MWDLKAGRKKIREYETKGSFGLCIDISRDGKFTASGHENGGVYVFNNDTGRMLYSLPGMYINQHFLSYGEDILTSYRSCQAGTDDLLLSSRYPTCSSWRRTSHRPLRRPTRRTSREPHRPFGVDLLGGLERYRRVSPQWIIRWESQGLVY